MGDNRGKLIENQPPPNAAPTPVAPSPRLTAELDRVAASARDLIDEITKKTNFEIDDEFPKQRLLDIAGSLTNLSAGSEDGALYALEYAASALNQVRFSSMEISDGGTMSNFARGGRLDHALGTLISDVSTAKQFYSQSKLDAASKSQIPDHAIATIGADQRNIIDRTRAVSDAGFTLAENLDKSARELAGRHDSDHIVADNLSRQTRDISNLTKQERIELDSAKPRIARLAKLHRGVGITLRGIELTAAVADITIRKIGHVLIAHFTDWFVGAQEWATETQAKIDELIRKWQEDDGAGRSNRRPMRHSSGVDGSLPMTIIPEGEFVMGSPSSEGKPDEHPARKIVIENPFEVSIAPVTRGEFAAFMTATDHKMDIGAYVWDGLTWNDDPSKSWRDPGFRQDDDHPVVCVSWRDAKAYVAWLAEWSGIRTYRLLSEAEWEYCCRAGTRTPYSTGETITTEQANFADLAHATTPTLRFPRNPWGLHDMHGNVWEWCEDHWHDDYGGNPPTTGSVWQGGDGTRRVLRGGSWFDPPEELRSASRNWERPASRFSTLGFRVARTL